jgi:hypothetical protein
MSDTDASHATGRQGEMPNGVTEVFQDWHGKNSSRDVRSNSRKK